MGLFSSIQWNPVHMQFAPPPGVQPVDASAFTTPQDRAAADKARRGDLMNQTMNSLTGQGNIQNAPAAGGVPGEGGGAAPPDSANIQSIMQSLGTESIAPKTAAGPVAAAGGGGGMMASIMKMLPMLMGS